MHYIIVKELTLEGLESSVNKRVDRGYVPTGGILRLTDRVRQKTDENPTGEWNTYEYFVQPMMRAMPEARMAQLRAAQAWEEFATPCGHRNEADCEFNAEKRIKCEPYGCPRTDKPYISRKGL